MSVGGGVDLDESLRECAVRELDEETGTRVEVSELVGPFHRVGPR